MAVPKRKPSKMKVRRRKATWKKSINKPTLTECGHCHAMKLPHVICPACGYYNKKQVITIKAKKK